jgi:DNA invertase Pin-like site-specific DNA recombinase
LIYAYYRVSSADQNYNSQKLGVEEYCKRCGYHIDKEVIDDGISGTVKAKDRHLWKIVKEAQKDDWVITSELSRIGRSTTDVLQTLNTLAKKGVNVYFVKQGMQLDQSPMGKMMTAILSAFAEMERDLISQRTKEGIDRAKREGKHVGRPFGSGNTHFKVEEEDIRLCRRSGLNWKQIGRYLNIDRTTAMRYGKMWEIK